VFQWLESSQLSAWVRTDLFGWPVALTLHALGTAIVVGLIIVISLRLLGLFELIPYRSLSRLFPIIWFGIALQFLSGFVLWMTKATRYVADGAFLLEVALIIAGIVLTYYFSATMNREAESWDAKGAISSQAARYIAAILAIWCAVVIAGRLTGYLGAIG